MFPYSSRGAALLKCLVIRCGGTPTHLNVLLVWLVSGIGTQVTSNCNSQQMGHRSLPRDSKPPAVMQMSRGQQRHIQLPGFPDNTEVCQRPASTNQYALFDCCPKLDHKLYV